MKDQVVFESLAKVPLFSYNSLKITALGRCKKEASMDMISAEDKIVNDGRVETEFIGKNLTTMGGMGLFHKFAD